MWNRHRESEIHDIHEIGSGTKLLFTFLSLKVIWHEERETQSFYADCFYICPKPRAAPHLQTTGLASAGPESQPSRSDAETQQTAFSQISAHASGAWRPNSYLGFLFWHLWMTHPLSTLMLHLTNPCTKWKILSLTKPKGKIYKTKSLGNYITQVQSIRVKMDLGVMAMKCYSSFPTAPDLELHHQIQFSSHIRIFVGGEMSLLSAYSTAPPN